MFGWRRGGRRRRERIDPFGVGEPWRHLVQGALQAQARYQRAVGSVAGGPLRERLDDIGRRVERATMECWHIAQRGDALADAVSTLGEGDTKVRLATMVADTRAQLAQVESGLGRAVASAVELAARRAAATSADANDLGDDVDHLVVELASLRSALDELTSPGA